MWNEWPKSWNPPPYSIMTKSGVVTYEAGACFRGQPKTQQTIDHSILFTYLLLTYLFTNIESG